MIRSKTRFLSALVFFFFLETGIAAAPAGADRVPEIQKKVTELQKQMNQVAEVPKLMDKFESLMKEQKFVEAEKVVDAATKKLKEFKASP